MGDIAEDYFDDGLQQLAEHDSGQCEGDCPYCAEEDEE